MESCGSAQEKLMMCVECFGVGAGTDGYKLCLESGVRVAKKRSN